MPVHNIKILLLYIFRIYFPWLVGMLTFNLANVQNWE